LKKQRERNKLKKRGEIPLFACQKSYLQGEAETFSKGKG
jgi:hypothetical protein